MCAEIKKPTKKPLSYIREITLAFLYQLLWEEKTIVITFVDDRGLILYYADEFCDYFNKEIESLSLSECIKCNKRSNHVIGISTNRASRSRLQETLSNYFKCYKEGRLSDNGYYHKSYKELHTKLISLKPTNGDSLLTLNSLEYVPIILYNAFAHKRFILDYQLNYQYYHSGYDYLNVYNEEHTEIGIEGYYFEQNWEFKAVIDTKLLNDIKEVALSPQSALLYEKLKENRAFNNGLFTVDDIKGFLENSKNKISKERLDKAISRLNEEVMSLLGQDSKLIKYNRKMEFYELNDIWGD